MRRAQSLLKHCLTSSASHGAAAERPAGALGSVWHQCTHQIQCIQMHGLAQDAQEAPQHGTSPLHAPMENMRHLQQHHASSALIMDGRSAAAAWTDTLALEVARVSAAIGRPPGLAVIQVGERPDSVLYVARKQEACERIGISASIHRLSVGISQDMLEGVVAGVCADEAVDGVLVQLPLPRHLDEEGVMGALDPKKDVDGFHPLNMGRMLMRGRTSRFVPCTPLGVIELLDRCQLDVRGCKAVVLGDSNVVGTPMSVLLRDRGAAAVTVCHRPAVTSYQEWLEMVDEEQLQRLRVQASACLPILPGPRPAGSAAAAEHHASANAQQGQQQPGAPSGGYFQAQQLPDITRTADVLVVAVGHPELVRANWVKPGAVVIDIGINIVPAGDAATSPQGGLEGSNRAGQGDAAPLSLHSSLQQWQQRQVQQDGAALPGYRVVGDVAFQEVSQVASAITPVPGGVGPMTIGAVCYNTLRAAEYNAGLVPW